MSLCDYGCGQEAIHQFKNGKWCCGTNIAHCPTMRKIFRESNIGEKNHQYGKKRSFEHSLKISIANTGKIRSEEYKDHLRKLNKGKEPWNKGLCFVNDDPYCPLFSNKEWREMIYERDSYTCQNCGITQRLSYKVYTFGLAIHHIDHNKQNCDPQNCITLCCKCNAKANFNRWMWKLIYQDKLGVFN